MEKTILCYGDSNTWGYMPDTGERYDEKTRWPRRMAEMLGSGYHVIEEGLNGRTTAFDDPIEPFRNGRKSLEVCLLTHSPIDLIIVMLGTNDTKKFLNLTPYMIAKGLESLVSEMDQIQYGRGGLPPKILVVSPLLVLTDGLNAHLSEYFDRESEEKSRALSEKYRQVAEQNGCFYLDAAKYAKASMRDGIHLEPEGHRVLAETICASVKKLFA